MAIWVSEVVSGAGQLWGGVQELSQGSDLCIGLILAEQAGRQEGRQTGETLENGLPQLSASIQHPASATRTGKCYQSPPA